MCWGNVVYQVMEVVGVLLFEDGIECNVIDLCSLSLWDSEVVVVSVWYMGRLLVA